MGRGREGEVGRGREGRVWRKERRVVMQRVLRSNAIYFEAQNSVQNKHIKTLYLIFHVHAASESHPRS